MAWNTYYFLSFGHWVEARVPGSSLNGGYSTTNLLSHILSLAQEVSEGKSLIGEDSKGKESYSRSNR